MRNNVLLYLEKSGASGQRCGPLVFIIQFIAKLDLSFTCLFLAFAANSKGQL